MPRAFHLANVLTSLWTGSGVGLVDNTTVVGAVGVTAAMTQAAFEAATFRAAVTNTITNAVWSFGAVNLQPDGTVDATSATAAGIAAAQVIDAVIFFVDTGNAATSKLLAYVDDYAELPLTTDGNNVEINLPAELFRAETAPP